MLDWLACRKYFAYNYWFIIRDRTQKQPNTSVCKVWAEVWRSQGASPTLPAPQVFTSGSSLTPSVVGFMTD